MPKDLFPFIPLAIVVLIVLRRAGRSQRVRTQRMWITPLLSLTAVATALAREPVPGAAAIAILTLAAAIGIASGYLRALHTELTVDNETGAVSSKATPVGTVLIVVFLLVRVGLDYAINGAWKPGPPRFTNPSSHGVDLFRLADAAVMFAAGMMVAQRVEIWRRAQKLLKEHRESRMATLPPA
jgi:hypothetical protein